MRLFVQHANRTVVVALKDGDAMTDLVDKCSNKFGDDLPASFHLCLDVDGHPIIDDLGEVRDGDKICVKAAETTPPPASTSSSSVVVEDDDSEEDDDNDEDSEEDDEDSDDDEESDEDDYSEEDDEDYVEPTKKRARTEGRAPSSSPITLEAVMDESVVPPVTTTTSSTDAEIKERIRNILQRGLHPNTPEAEAANSMRLAERMLRKHNVSRAEVMMNAEHASENGDMVKVHIRNPATKKPSTTKNWFHNLAHAICKHFKCKVFFNLKMSVRCHFTFYGISSNVYAAAFAFETAFNRIMTLASQHTVPAGEYERKLRNGEILVCRATYTKSARVSYCDGLAMGLRQRVNDLTASPSQPEEVEYTVTAEEDTRLACVTRKVEESVLAKNNITFSNKTSHKYTSVRHRAESYAEGKRDSSNIDLQQRTIA